MKTSAGQNLAIFLGVGAWVFLAHLPPIEEIFSYHTGLRHFMPIRMDFGAPWAGYFLNFVEDGKGNYTSDPDVDMWQSMVGYTPTYDFFFSLGGSIFRDKFEFKAPAQFPASLFFDEAFYVIWIWKGDYWNLGAGAEIGIYRTYLEHHANNGFYNVVPTLTLDVDMTIRYAGNTLNHLIQTNWWVCSFTPDEQLIDINLLEVEASARFTDPLLREPFYNQYVANKNSENEWKAIEIIEYPPYTDNNVNEYQFTIDFNQKNEED